MPEVPGSKSRRQQLLFNILFLLTACRKGEEKRKRDWEWPIASDARGVGFKIKASATFI